MWAHKLLAWKKGEKENILFFMHEGTNVDEPFFGSAWQLFPYNTLLQEVKF